MSVRSHLCAVFSVTLSVLVAGMDAGAQAVEGEVRLLPASYADLPGWAADAHAEALAAFHTSCAPVLRAPVQREVAAGGAVPAAEDWREACLRATNVDPGNEAARDFFETWFTPHRLVDATSGEEREGLFTGYYEPLLHGARKKGGQFRFPLHARPPDLVTVDLGSFDEGLRGERVTGRVEGGQLVPYHDRAAIDGGALAGKGLELLWVDDPVAAFFLHVQGSGQVELPTGERVRVGYAGANGRPYHAIGRDLVERGALPLGEVSLQSIRRWLHAHPEMAAEVMAKNRAYVFFRELGPVQGSLGPPGAAGVPLMPGRSLAIDPKFVDYGTPVFLDLVAPFPEGVRKVRRLTVAQDTGTAIKGAVRGDLFWGAGPRAEWVAGRMRSSGRYYLLLPRADNPGAAAGGKPRTLARSIR